MQSITDQEAAPAEFEGREEKKDPQSGSFFLVQHLKIQILLVRPIQKIDLFVQIGFHFLSGNIKFLAAF